MLRRAVRVRVLQVASLGAVLCARRAHAWMLIQSPADSSTKSSNVLASDQAALAPARILLQQGKTGEAEQSVREYLDTHPNSADARFLLGYILFKNVKPKESLAEYTEGAKYRVPGPFELKVVGLDYALLGDYADADKWLTRSLKSAPGDSDGWYYLGRARYNASRYLEAIDAFQQCLKLEPRNVKAEDNLGLAYHYLGQRDEALTAYRTAISWQADAQAKNPDPLLNLGILLIEMNRPQEAITYLRLAAAITPDVYRSEGMAELEPRVHEQLSTAYSRLNQVSQARMEMEKAVQLTPQNARLHFLLARLYQKEGLTERAKAEFGRYDAMLQEKKPVADRKP